MNELFTYSEENLIFFYIIVQLCIDAFPLFIASYKSLSSLFVVVMGFFMVLLFSYLLAWGVYLISNAYIYPMYGARIGSFICTAVYATGYNLTRVVVKKKDPIVFKFKMYASLFVYPSGAVLTFLLFTILAVLMGR